MDSISFLKESLQKMKIKYDASQLDKLTAFQMLLEKKNRAMNLIGPARTSEILKKHILDSLSILSFTNFFQVEKSGTRILDVGSGGGLPGIPVGILLNKSSMVLLEKSKKKSSFLLQVIKDLSLTNIKVLTGRAEEFARQDHLRESFDIVMARAVTKFNILLELSIPFCNINGKIIFYKSKKVFDELETGGDAIDALGGSVEELVEVDIPGLEGFRALLVISKKENTPVKFPRKFSQIKKKPL